MRDRIKISFFTDDMIMYLDNLKEYILKKELYHVKAKHWK